jgi:murein L,D-transpeptidase YcbB/YkuD
MAAALALTVVPGQALAQTPVSEIQAAIETSDSDRDIRAFYGARGHRPIWTRNGALGAEAETLLDLLRTAHLDGLDPDDYRPRSLASAMRKAEGGSPKALAKAELLLSRSLAAYVRDVRRPRDVGIHYVDPELAPSVPATAAILQAAATAPSLDKYLQDAGWMHPVYGQLRNGLANSEGLSPALRRILMVNLDRARALPAGSGRHILVDAAGARLYMYDGRRMVDSMRVVVGKASEPTPMMAGLIRFAMVNPYWNIPPDLVRSRVAANVLDKGALLSRDQALSAAVRLVGRSRRPEAVGGRLEGGRQRIARIARSPASRRGQCDGRMKFMFPNELGVYLHDTPEKGLLNEEVRNFSSGCVRLEDARRLAKWLFGKPLTTKSKKAEQQVDLPTPVPVYITYLTAAPKAGASPTATTSIIATISRRPGALRSPPGEPARWPGRARLETMTG